MAELYLDDIPRLTVFNKMDLVSPEIAANLARRHQGVAIAAHDRMTLAPLIKSLQNIIWQHLHDDL